MPLILGFFGFLLLTVIWLAWAVVWLVAAITWFLWPLALLVIGGAMWRRQARRWQPLYATARPTRPVRQQPVRESGNGAFDAYREETLRRLEEEREKFRDFLDRRRKAKDKEAFDRYMDQRRAQPLNGPQGFITDAR